MQNPCESLSYVASVRESAMLMGRPIKRTAISKCCPPCTYRHCMLPTMTHDVGLKCAGTECLQAPLDGVRFTLPGLREPPHWE